MRLPYHPLLAFSVLYGSLLAILLGLGFVVGYLFPPAIAWLVSSGYFNVFPALLVFLAASGTVMAKGGPLFTFTGATKTKVRMAFGPKRKRMAMALLFGVVATTFDMGAVFVANLLSPETIGGYNPLRIAVVIGAYSGIAWMAIDGGWTRILKGKVVLPQHAEERPAPTPADQPLPVRRDH